MTYRGLTTAEAEASRRIHGANVLPEPARLTFGQAFLETFRDPMIRILLVMVALMVTMYFVGYAEIYEPVGTIVTVLIVATVTSDGPDERRRIPCAARAHGKGQGKTAPRRRPPRPARG